MSNTTTTSTPLSGDTSKASSQKRKLSGNAWIKIFLVSALCLIVVAAFVVGATGFGSFSFNASSIGKHAWQVGSGNTAATGLRSIAMEWFRGDVTITTWEGSEIQIIDRAESLPNTQRIHWALEGDTLYVLSDEPMRMSCSYNWSSHSCEIRIPASLAKNLSTLNLSIASGTVKLDGITCSSLTLSIASGDFTIQRAEARTTRISIASGKLSTTGFISDSLDLSLVSGITNLSGTFRTMDLSVTSGTLTVYSSNAPSSIKTNVVSGSARLNFPEPSGFTASVSKVTGQFNCGFAVTGSGNSYVFGDGSARYSFDIVSGSISLNPA